MRKVLIVCLFLIGISLSLLGSQEADGFIEMDYSNKGCLWIEKKHVFPEDIYIIKGVRIDIPGKIPVTKMEGDKVLEVGKEEGRVEKNMTFSEFIDWVMEGKAVFTNVSFVAKGSGGSWDGYVIIYYKWKKLSK
jgi:hypothetical protein